LVLLTKVCSQSLRNKLGWLWLNFNWKLRQSQCFLSMAFYKILVVLFLLNVQLQLKACVAQDALILVAWNWIKHLGLKVCLATSDFLHIVDLWKHLSWLLPLSKFIRYCLYKRWVIIVISKGIMIHWTFNLNLWQIFAWVPDCLVQESIIHPECAVVVFLVSLSNCNILNELLFVQTQSGHLKLFVLAHFLFRLFLCNFPLNNFIIVL
jgi:hypothetical protein